MNPCYRCTLHLPLSNNLWHSYYASGAGSSHVARLSIPGELKRRCRLYSKTLLGIFQMVIQDHSLHNNFLQGMPYTQNPLADSCWQSEYRADTALVLHFLRDSRMLWGTPSSLPCPVARIGCIQPHVYLIACLEHPGKLSPPCADDSYGPTRSSPPQMGMEIIYIDVHSYNICMTNKCISRHYCSYSSQRSPTSCWQYFPAGQALQVPLPDSSWYVPG